MSDRKYRQRGYMDDERDRKPERPKGPPGPAGPRPERPEGPRTPNLMAAREVVRCSRCGAEISNPFAADARCSRCGADVHACAQCCYFDPGARFQCMQPVPARVAPKDVKNTCTLFEPRRTVERETHSAAPSAAKKALDDLFNF